jgi:hypothetical protein
MFLLSKISCPKTHEKSYVDTLEDQVTGIIPNETRNVLKSRNDSSYVT